MTSEMVAWGTNTSHATESGIANAFRPSMVKRARKRDCHPTPSGSWIVVGNRKLGDSYPYYTVTEEEDGLHHCSCQDHAGGEYRKVCTHIVGVLLRKEENEEGERVSASSNEGEDAGEDEERKCPDNPISTPPSPASTDGSSSAMGAVPSPSATPDPPRTSTPTYEGGSVWEGKLADLRSDEWGTPPFPDWVESLRPHQTEAIIDIMEAYERGAKVVFLDAPTGSGKTLIAEVVRRLLLRNHNGRGVYSCTTKTLQDQVLEDYPYAAVLKGRANYPTELAPFPDVTAADCTASGDTGCNWCTVRSDCPYQRAKGRALASELAVLNSSYLLTAWNGPRTFQDRELVILDECDLLEGELMSFVEVFISESKQRRYRLGEPDRKTVKESWLSWVLGALPKLSRALASIPESSTDVRVIREARWLTSTITNLTILRDGLSGEETQWVYDKQRGAITFRPVQVDKFGEEYLWRHGRRFLLMSASIISPAEMAMSLGLEDKWEVVKVESTFPPENRPVRVMYAGAVTAKTYDDVVDEVGRYVHSIVTHHATQNILVHTVSYKMAKDLHERVRVKGVTTYTYTSSSEREGMLREWMKEGGVMFAPSFDRGVDLPGELCEVQVIAKVPYPYLGDKQVNTRLYGTKGGQLWYAVQTVRTLVQMTGRGVRSKDDTCTTYILDRQFQTFWNRNKRLFPDWWVEGLDLTGRTRPKLGL